MKRWRVVIAVVLLSATVASCADDPVDVSEPDEPNCEWPMWGHSVERTFDYPCESGITPETVDQLGRVWYVRTSDVVTAAPVIADNRLYAGDWAGRFYALDTETGDEIWHFDVEPTTVYAGQITSSASLAEVEGVPAVIFNGGRTVYALARDDGRELWSTVIGDEPAEIESAPLVVGDAVIITYDVHNAPRPAGMKALDRETGDVRWTFDPEQGGPYNGCGDMWGSASADLERRLVFAGTANCPTSPEGWGQFTEALIAVDLDSGRARWSYQPHEPNNDDSDFAGAPVVYTAGDRDLVTLGSKDGTMYAVERDTGKLAWSADAAPPNILGKNFSSGGFIGPTAYSEGMIVGGTGVGECPCMHGIDAETGEIVWQQQAAGPTYAPTTAVNGVAFTGSVDFALRAYDVTNGEILWQEVLTAPISGGVTIIGDDLYAVSGFREPGTAGPSETAGIFKYSLGAESIATTAPATTNPGPAVPVRITSDSPCLDETCDVPFELIEPPAGLDPTLTLTITSDPFMIEVVSEGLGEPVQWIREGSPAVDVGAVAFGVFMSERDDDPQGGVLCVLGPDGACSAEAVPVPGQSYNRISVLAVADTERLPDPVDGFDRLVTTLSFTPPLQTEEIE